MWSSSISIPALLENGNPRLHWHETWHDDWFMYNSEMLEKMCGNFIKIFYVSVEEACIYLFF